MKNKFLLISIITVINYNMAIDTFFSDAKSLKQNIRGRVYTHTCGFTKPHPMLRATGTSIGHSLRDFVNDFGAPALLTFDGAATQIGENIL